TLDHGLGSVRPTAETLMELRRTYDGLLVTTKFSTSDELKDSIVGQVAIIDAMRRRTPSLMLRRELTMLMARHGEMASCLYEESGDIHSALYWVDRTAVWSEAAQWSDMGAYTFYRRSQIAMSYTDDARQIIEHAQTAMR